MPQFYHDLITLNLCNMFKKDASFLLTKFQAKQSWEIAMSKNAGIIHRCDFCMVDTTEYKLCTFCSKKIDRTNNKSEIKL